MWKLQQEHVIHRYIKKKHTTKNTYLPTLLFLDPLPETQIFFLGL
jgi:hypothetical protein